MVLLSGGRAPGDQRSWPWHSFVKGSDLLMNWESGTVQPLVGGGSRKRPFLAVSFFQGVFRGFVGFSE